MFYADRDLAKLAGSRGGRISRRGKAKLQTEFTPMVFSPQTTPPKQSFWKRLFDRKAV